VLGDCWLKHGWLSSPDAPTPLFLQHGGDLGDPALPAVLEHAGLDRARALAVTLSDVAHGEVVVTAARRINPGLDVIAMGVDEESHERLRQLGADEVVHAEFEVGMEFVRHTLHRYGVSSQEIQALLSRRRRDYHAG
jgi:CPA2 family monovalent cation:H+ antiporter-2